MFVEIGFDCYYEDLVEFVEDLIEFFDRCCWFDGDIGFGVYVLELLCEGYGIGGCFEMECYVCGFEFCVVWCLVFGIGDY